MNINIFYIKFKVDKYDTTVLRIRLIRVAIVIFAQCTNNNDKTYLFLNF